MAKFQLKVQEFIQGDFAVKPLNLAFVFQVNCPGCFIYGIPLVNELHRRFAEKIGFIGISTAFEDFSINTALHTRELLNDGTLVGETKKYYEEQVGAKVYAQKINFPVAFDSLSNTDDFLTVENVNKLCTNIPAYKDLSELMQKELKGKIGSYYKSLPAIAETFTLNQLRGTPSFVIFDNNFTLLESLFGHQKSEILQAKLSEHLS